MFQSSIYADPLQNNYIIQQKAQLKLASMYCVWS